jgi:uncharacterized protein (DUF1697 family)
VTRYVALFRGINVGRAKRVAMGDLRRLMESLGFTDVETLLNSGNVVFESGSSDTDAMAGTIRAAVAKKLGVDAFVLVKSARDIAAVVKGNKLAAIARDPSRFLIALTAQPRGLAALSRLVEAGADDVVHIGKHAAYIWCPRGFLESKAAGSVLKKLGEVGTTRNWTTIEKIDALMRR